jgi:PIN domain nuclease of toxin-antitoxin system
MKYLLDTAVWIWSVHSSERIGERGLAILENGFEEVYFSVASTWEITIKFQLGKLDLPGPPPQYIPRRLADQGIRPLIITQAHALKVYDLPAHHKDPFDRMLIAQALVEDMIILTADRSFRKYPAKVLWCGI